MIRNEPLVSVILPTYNRAALLSRAINSVMAQTYPNWELMIWDDGSIDQTADLIRAYTESRVRNYFAANHGVSYARNRAVEVTQGEYIAFLDSDDEWSADKLALQLDMLQKHPQIDVLFADFWNITQKFNSAQRTFQEYAAGMDYLDKQPIGEHGYIITSGLSESLAKGNFIATDTIILRRRVVEYAGLFNEQLRNSEDFELWWRLALTGLCFGYIDKPLLTRYKLNSNLSSASLQASQNTLKALDLCLQEAVSKGRSDLVPHLNTPYRNAWQNMILLSGQAGDRKGAGDAFLQSLKYGFRPGSVRLLLTALIQSLKPKQYSTLT